MQSRMFRTAYMNLPPHLFKLLIGPIADRTDGGRLVSDVDKTDKSRRHTRGAFEHRVAFPFVATDQSVQNPRNLLTTPVSARSAPRSAFALETRSHWGTRLTDPVRSNAKRSENT